MKYSDELAEVISTVLKGEWKKEEVAKLMEKPKKLEHGNLAFPCFTLAKAKCKAPNLIANELSAQLNSPLITKAEAVGGYVNVFLNQKLVTNEVLTAILRRGDSYGDNTNGNGKTVTIDMSSPNIAKPFSMGHLRSTVIGNSLSLILEKNGYKVVKINHLGDWGTQFGKLITAYKLWGSKDKVKQEPIKELLSLYVKFHKEAEVNLKLEGDARAWFKKLEDGDSEAISLWRWFRDESLKEFSRIYELMNIEFNSIAGEAFYNDKMEAVVQQLEEQQLLEDSDSAMIVSLDKEGMPPCLIKKSDGATLYATRDLAAAIYRHNTYGSENGLYVVGNEQSLHFQQLFAVLGKMGYDWAGQLVHIPFGMMLKDGKKMSTRKGKVILLEEVLQQSITLAQKNIEEKNSSLANKDETAKQVGVGAVLFHDLKNFRSNDIEFSLEDMLRAEGETGPYVQYTHARAFSLLRKGKWKAGEEPECVNPKGSAAWKVNSLLVEFPDTVKRSLEKYDPSQIAKYVVDLAQAFNKYYGEVQILEENEGKQERLSLVFAVSTVLKEGLRLLGIAAPEEM